MIHGFGYGRPLRGLNLPGGRLAYAEADGSSGYIERASQRS
jgi:hypothetical protein